MGQADPGVALLLEANADFLRLLDDGRVECVLNKHVMPARTDVLESFLRSVDALRAG